MVAKSGETKKNKAVKEKKVTLNKGKRGERKKVTEGVAQDNVNGVFSPDMFFKIFYEGWKNAFNLKGRTSKLEVWCFLLVNSVLVSIIQLRSSYVISSDYLVNANLNGYSLQEIERNIAWANFWFWISFLFPLVPLLSMLIRRMHDVGKLAWHGYLEQVGMGVVAMSMLLVGIDELEGTNLEYTILALSVCFITIFYSVMYYGLKFLIVTLFYKGDEGDNEYGSAPTLGNAFDDVALKFSIFYVLFIFTLGMLYWGSWYF